MNIVPEAHQLIDLLLQGTSAEKFAWRSTSEPATFRLLTPSGYIHIHKIDAEPPIYGIEAYGADGETLTEPLEATARDFLPLANLYEEVASRLRRRGIGKLLQELQDVMEGKATIMTASGGSSSGGSSPQGLGGFIIRSGEGKK